MGHHEWTEHEIGSIGFFAQFVDAPPEVVGAVETERGGDLAAVVAEDKAFGYWEKKMAARAARRAARERAEWAARARSLADTAARLRPDERARLAPLPDASAVTLPEPRCAILTMAERTETARWWHRLDTPTTGRSFARRVRNEVRDAEHAERRAARAVMVWRDEQRAFERAQWHAVVANRKSRPARKVANRWVAIDEDRALAIAIAALAKTDPPQGRK